MTIIHSEYKVDSHPQVDGRYYVTEYHTDSTGIVHQLEYGPMDPLTNFQAILDARASQIAEQLAAQEAEALWASN